MRIARAVASAVTLAVLVVGVPLALVAFGRLPGWSDLADLPGEALTDTTAFALLTVLAWAAWALFTVAVVLELAGALAGVRRWRLPAGAPFQASARRLVAALTMTASLSGPLVGRVGLLPAPSVPAAEATSPAARPPEAARLAAHAAPAVGRSVAAPQPAPGPGAAAADLVDGASVTVAVGDTPWGLAERHLGSGLRWREIWELNRGRPQPDGRAWVTEDLIQPGWQLRLPADAAEVAAPGPASPRIPAPDDGPGVYQPDAGRAPERGATTSDGSAVDRVPDGSEAGPGATSTTRPNETRPDPPTTSPSAEPTVGDEPSLGVPTLLGITGATVVATALAYELRRRRQRRSAVTAHADWRPGSDEDTETEHAIAAASDLPLVRWAGHHLASLVATHPPGRLEGAPVAVELSEEAGIELLWDAPNPVAPRPWSVADGGWAWRLAYDPDAPVPVNDQPAGIPGLVTIGHRDGRQLLVDLEAFGSLVIDGDSDRALDLARAVTFELGTSEELASAQLVLAGIDILGADQLPRAGNAHEDDPLSLVRSTVEWHDDTLRCSYAPSTFDYRLGGDAWTDVVAVVASGGDPGAVALVQASRPRRGVATVAVGSVPGAGAVVQVAGDGTARLEAPQLATPITFVAAGLPAESADAVNSLLEALDQPVPEPSPAGSGRDVPPALEYLPAVSGNGEGGEPTPDAGAPVSAEPSEGDERRAGDAVLAGDDDEQPARPELLVKVLCTPHVPDRPNLKRRQLQLVVYLASMGEPTPASRVQHAVWQGRAVARKTIWNTATRTRSALGDLADGTPAMPKSRRDHNTLAVDPRVRTDLQLLDDLYAHAQGSSSARAIELLTEGLGLIEGQPFDGPDYEWAHHSELLVADATKLIEDAALQLVDLATDAGRTDLARFAVTQGLRALRGNEFLYRARMRIEHDAGNLSAARAAYSELVSFLADIDAEPSPPTIELYRRLIGKSGRQAS